MKKKLHRLLQFVSNAILACYHIIRGSTSWRAAVARIWGILIEIVKSLHRPYVNDGIYEARNLMCSKCCLWDPKRETCGFIGEFFRDEDRQKKTLGCWCTTWFKNRRQCNCWKFDRQVSGGWPKELNSFTE